MDFLQRRGRGAHPGGPAPPRQGPERMRHWTGWFGYGDEGLPGRRSVHSFLSFVRQFVHSLSQPAFSLSVFRGARGPAPSTLPAGRGQESGGWGRREGSPEQALPASPFRTRTTLQAGKDTPDPVTPRRGPETDQTHPLPVRCYDGVSGSSSSHAPSVFSGPRAFAPAGPSIQSISAYSDAHHPSKPVSNAAFSTPHLSSGSL